MRLLGPTPYCSPPSLEHSKIGPSSTACNPTNRRRSGGDTDTVAEVMVMMQPASEFPGLSRFRLGKETLDKGDIRSLLQPSFLAHAAFLVFLDE